MFPMPGENRGKRLGEFESRSVKIQTQELLKNSQTLLRFSPGYEGTKTRFISFIKLLAFNLTKRKTIYEVRMNSFISFTETVNSHNLEKANSKTIKLFLNFIVYKTIFFDIVFLSFISTSVSCMRWRYHKRTTHLAVHTARRVSQCNVTNLL